MKFSRKPSNISFYCPICHNKTLYCVDHDCARPSDVDWHDNFVCEECGAEVVSEPQYDNKIRFVQDIESAEDTQSYGNQSRHARSIKRTKPLDVVYDSEKGYGLAKYDPKSAADRYGNRWITVRWEDGTTTNKLLSTLTFVNDRFQHNDYDEYYDFLKSIGRPISEVNSIQSAYVPERPIDPPEDNRFSYLPEYEATVDLTLNTVIFVDDDGNWEYQDTEYPWAASDGRRGSWYDDEYNIYLGDKTDIIEHTDDLLYQFIPARVGTYRIKADVKLVFDIYGIEELVTDTWYDEHSGYDYDSEIYTDDARADFNFEKSSIKNFRMEPID